MPLPAESDARRALDALPGIRWRSFQREDLPAIAAFYTECETYDAKPERTSLVILQEFWTRRARRRRRTRSLDAIRTGG